jgi:hypothetical protein
MSIESLAERQFYTQQNMIRQGNDDAMLNKVRGIQNMTSNIYRPSFSSDITTVRAMPSGTAPESEEGQQRMGPGIEQNENEE